MPKFETIALCDDCWDTRRPGHLSPRTQPGDLAFCHACGQLTRSGIYMKTDVEAEPAAPPAGTGLGRDATDAAIIASLKAQICSKQNALRMAVDNLERTGALVDKLRAELEELEARRPGHLLDAIRKGERPIADEVPWLVKDFHVLYKVAEQTVLQMMGLRPLPSNHNVSVIGDLRAQVDRLRPAFLECDAVRAACKRESEQ